MLKPLFPESGTKTTTDYVAFSLVEKQNAAVAVVEMCLDSVNGSLQPCKTTIKEGKYFALYSS